MEMISLEEAQRLICLQSKCTGIELLPIEDCIGRILAEDLHALVSHPPFPRSAMDGYALSSNTLRDAREDHPVKCSVIYKICAGQPTGRAIAEGEAVRIMTGGMIPEGADCVVPQEFTDYGEEEVSIYRKAEPGDNYCPEGEDFHAGELLAEKGMRVDSYMIAAAVAAGKESLQVYRRLRAAVITTGDELCRPGQELKTGQIYDSNMAYICSRLKELGCELNYVYCAGDNVNRICQAVMEAGKESDFIITTGGVSVGEKDLLPAVMESLHARQIFHGIRIKPGMPTMFSVYDGIPVLSLSGNPYSSSAMFELLVKPFLAKSSGENRNLIEMRTVLAVMAEDYPKKSPVRRFIRGKYDGSSVWAAVQQRNGQLKAGIGSNCLIDIPEGSAELKAGDAVRILYYF